MSATGTPVVVLCADLFFASQVDGAARLTDTLVCLVDDEEAAASAVLRLSPQWVIVDLENPGLNVTSLVTRFGSGRPKLLGFYPHVRKDLLDAAQGAGFERVISRGQFSSQLVDILKSSR